MLQVLITHLSFDFSVVLLSLTLLALVGLLLYAQIQKDTFDIRDLLLDQTTGKLTLHSFSAIIVLIFSTWVVVNETLHGRATQWLILSYMGAWLGAGTSAMIFKRPGTDACNNDLPQGPPPGDSNITPPPGG